MGYVFGSSSPALYINGVKVYTWSSMGAETTQTYTNCHFGYSSCVPSESMVGSVDDIRLYTRELSSDEMLALAAK